MRAAIIVDGKVDNIIEVDALDVLEGVALVDAPSASIGDAWDGEKFVAPAPVPPPLPVESDYVNAIQAMLDRKVQERRYLSILSACSYAASTNTTFKAEADACNAWRDAVWLKAYSVLDEVKTGTLAQPAIPDLLAMLPALTWPT
jgi:hypothetical protein